MFNFRKYPNSKTAFLILFLLSNMLFVGCSLSPFVIIVKDERSILQQTSFLRVKSSPPFANYTVNGAVQGVTPTSGFMPIVPGVYRFEFFHQSGMFLDTTIIVGAGQVVDLKVNLLGAQETDEDDSWN